MQNLRLLLDNPAVSVFLGTLPLLGAIVWGLLQNDRRLAALDKRMDNFDKRMDGFESRMARMESRLDGIDNKLAAVSERLVKVETKLEGGHLILGR